jgi:Kef-type K+ transport system membrane component KefB
MTSTIKTPSRPSRPPSGPLTLAVYGGMLVVAGVAFLLIRSRGEGLVQQAGAVAVPIAKLAHSEVLLHVLLAMVVVIAAARALGAVFRAIGQPAVIGEVIAGIMLGPSLLGRISPAAQSFVLPQEIAPHLGVVAQVGVLLFMFLVGLELDTSLLRKRSHATLAISHTSIVVPFLMGAALSLLLYPSLSPSGVSFTNFSLFLGLSLSITAFPVLARILSDRGIQRSQLGVVAIACAAIDDASAWCLLAVVVGIVRSAAANSLVTIALTAAYVAFMAFVVRPLAVKLVRRAELVERAGSGGTALVFVALLVSALVTEAIGIHALFGAFLLGAVIPHDSALSNDIRHRLEEFVVVVLLPAFFALTGMRTEMGLLSTTTDWLFAGLILLVACAGKFGGAMLSARFTGFGWRDASMLGALMNTRGLMELVVLNIGLDLGVITPRLFAMLVIMAVVTTLMTSPLLTLLSERRELTGRLDTVL